MTNDLSERLAALRVEMPPATEAMHLAAIRRELVDPASVPVPMRTHRRPRRRIVAAMAAAMILLLPAAAIAADDTVPGDVLYPVKRSAEWAWSFVDSEVAARHRVEELEIVLDRGASPAEVQARLRDAEAAVDEDSPALIQRLERARQRVRAGEGQGAENPGGAGPGSDSGGSGRGSGQGAPGGDAGPIPSDPAADGDPLDGGTSGSGTGGDPDTSTGSGPADDATKDSGGDGAGSGDQERARERGEG